ncbi:Oil body-associated protein 1A [Diplogelasinospora grovesii]|uniref:Oil body-associated protein 1A n=1 Tax=Diplogelasinospora grovesii TaxID=303347 RepID=A0AAN6N3L4_9PEZI|nr:Oil body-associated protein 1A [Diplogelasinospora grovesii]
MDKVNETLDSKQPAPHVEGDPRSVKSKVLESGASITQDFSPLKSVCAHLSAFHAYASDPSRYVEVSHYCGHLTEDIRQCLLYDSPAPNARLIGVEYMIAPELYETLDADERKLWHSHVFEVKSGMLIMPRANPMVPQSVWETAENADMEQLIRYYGKVYHLWQTDKGHKLPLGEPQLMTSFTAKDQFDFEKAVGERDERYGTDWKHKTEIRKDIPEPEIHPDADQAWKKQGVQGSFEWKEK